MNNNTNDTDDIEIIPAPPKVTAEDIKKEKTYKRRLFEKGFAKEYVRNGMNGLQAYKKMRPIVKDSSAGVEATKALKIPSVREEITLLLQDNNLALEDVLKVHTRNLNQDKNLNVSQTAVQDAYKLHGVRGFSRDSDKGGSVNVAIVIKK